MQVKLDNYIMDVIITYKNNKNIYFRVKEDLKLYVTCNKFVSLKNIEKLIYDNSLSIIKMYEYALKNAQYKNEFHYLGDKYNLIYYDKIITPYFQKDNFYVKNNKMLEKFWKDECLRIFNKRVLTLKELFDYLPEFSLKIRFMKTRWGVCNRSNNTITLNSELLKKEITLLDYVIVHEMCHFKHPNHSKYFWNEVSKYYPYYKLARKKLKEV